MGFGSNSERSSNPQQSSRTGKEKAHLPHADLRLKNQGKLNVKNDPYGILPGEIMNNRIQSTLVETKPFGDCKGQPLKRKPTKEDELVRYMSNLPGYLQRVDSSDNLQEKALNVGVLDWARLEKWKYHQKHMPTTTGNNVSRTNAKSSAFSNDVPKVASANKGMLRSSTCSSLTPSQKDDILEKKTPKTYKSFDKINSDAILQKGKRKELDQKITSEMDNMPSNMRNHGVSPLPKENASVCDGGAKTRVEQKWKTDVNKKDLDDKTTSDMEASSSKSRNNAVSLVEFNPETDMMEQSLDFPSDVTSGPLFSDNTGNIRSQGKHSAENKTKSQDTDFETLKILEEEMAELATERSRTNSPNRRFSFSLSRIGRSFSFKESSAVPQLSSDYVSVRSGPVRSDSSGFLDDAHIEKLNGYHRTRSSPFRRVLDPLLKSKGLNSFRSTDTVQPSKGSLNSSTPRPLDANESFQEEKLGSSMTKALLEVAMKNGRPLFRFVVTNGSNMLATTVKSLASSDKVGSNQTYSLRLVKLRKEWQWINLTAEDSCDYHLVRESVLFGVEQRQADQALVKFTPSTSLLLLSSKYCMPNKGIPSPLIDRWDLVDYVTVEVGMLVAITHFSDQNSRCCKNSRPHQACPDRLELYPQGEAQQKHAYLQLVPYKKGIYAIKIQPKGNNVGWKPWDGHQTNHFRRSHACKICA
ncbi:UDP-glucosyl transferase 85A3, putative isoform 1 [Hibiscus syriacus]|uniref:UDP-glucosyl transferase 85A3, putative isoform 1 n=1 Tax=Hibiscus syriacus TaxID=106335 RepID=A0A6A3A0B2_HIBSY|nr:UDP-glucosyl transferase 85A3, putative isoform 1 [Hibiscus syriacus]